MHISSTSGKSTAVPPGLANRELDLPPGIAKKVAAGGTVPPGIVNRFPAAIPDTTDTQTGDVTPTDTSSQDSTTSVDLLV